MARSITYWYDIIIAEKTTMANLNGLQPLVNDAQSLLSDVKTSSKVARWRLWIWCVAVCAFSLDVIMDLFKIELEDIATRTRIGTEPWYANLAKEYQHGYNLIWQNNRFEYSIVDDAAKIIKHSAAQENGSVMNIKVATLVGTVKTPLNASQVAGFNAYLLKTRPACIPFNIITDNPDDLKIFANVIFDALVLTSSGESILTPGVFPVEDAIKNHIDNIVFNGQLELCDLVDAIQGATGVVGVYITNAEARYGANPFVSFPERYESNAGHMTIFSGAPLNSTITYTSNV